MNMFSEGMDQKVFILDDDPYFTSYMQNVLNRLGVESESFNSYIGLDLYFKIELPKILLLDLNIVRPFDGFDVLKKIRARYNDKFQILMCTGSDDLHQISQALDLGATDYLIKPLDSEVLVSKLAHHLNLEKYVTDSIASDEMTLEQDIKLSLDLEARSIDEGKICIRSPHLISKGTVVQLQGAFISEIFEGKTDSILVTVVNSSVDEKGFLIEVEPDISKTESQASIRKWIACKKRVR